LYTSCILGLHLSALFIEFLLIKNKNKNKKKNRSHSNKKRIYNALSI
jgi:hypothetical protein